MKAVATFADVTNVLTPLRVAQLNRHAANAARRYRRVGIDGPEVLAEEMAYRATQGAASLLRLVTDDTYAIGRLASRANHMATTVARRARREATAVVQGTMGAAALASLGEGTPATPRDTGAMHRAGTGTADPSPYRATIKPHFDGIGPRRYRWVAAPLRVVYAKDWSAEDKDAAREASLSSDGVVNRPDRDGARRLARYAGAFDAQDKGASLQEQNRAMKTGEASVARVKEQRFAMPVNPTKNEGGTRLLAEQSLERLMSEIMRPGGHSAGFAETAGRMIGGTTTLALVAERAAATEFVTAFCDSVDYMGAASDKGPYHAENGADGAAIVARALQAWESQDEAGRGVWARILGARATLARAHAEFLGKVAGAEKGKRARTVRPQDIAAASLVAGVAERSALLAETTVRARHLSDLFIASYRVSEVSSEDISRKAPSGGTASLDLPSVTTVLRLSWGKGDRGPAKRLIGILESSRDFAIDAAANLRTGTDAFGPVVTPGRGTLAPADLWRGYSTASRLVARHAPRPTVPVPGPTGPNGVPQNGRYGPMVVVNGVAYQVPMGPHTGSQPIIAVGNALRTFGRSMAGIVTGPSVECSHVDLETGRADRCDCWSKGR